MLGDTDLDLRFRRRHRVLTKPHIVYGGSNNLKQRGDALGLTTDHSAFPFICLAPADRARQSHILHL